MVSIVHYRVIVKYSMSVGSMYIINSWFDPPSDITAIPQSYTVHCIIIGVIHAINEFHYYYHNSTDIVLNSTYCSSQTGYDCSLANNTVTSDMTPDNVVDVTITVTWEAEEISSGAFRQDNGDHIIKCNATRHQRVRISTITVRGDSMYYC